MISTLTKTIAAFGALLLLLPVLLGAAISGTISAVLGATGGATTPSVTAFADIPSDYLQLYRQAAAVCPGLDWSILAGIGHVESDHGRSRAPGVTSGENEAGAAGPMQFLTTTFDAVIARHQLPAGGAVPPSRYDAHDAIYAAAYNLCDNGAGRGNLHDAVHAYNHSDSYVRQVLDQAALYTTVADCHADPAPNAAAQAAITFACQQVGQPYVWGGNGPHDGGFDCSGLTKAAYAAAGITLPRTAQEQFQAGPPVPANEPLQPGDLVYYGTPADIHHVALYIGHGHTITAPQQGEFVKRAETRYPGDDYAGATRPVNKN